MNGRPKVWEVKLAALGGVANNRSRTPATNNTSMFFGVFMAAIFFYGRHENECQFKEVTGQTDTRAVYGGFGLNVKRTMGLVVS